MTTITPSIGEVFQIGNRFGIHLLDGTDAKVLGVGGKGLTLAEAEKVMDWLENRTNKEQCSGESNRKTNRRTNRQVPRIREAVD